EDDLNIGVKSTAILFGRFDRLAIGLLQIAMLVTLLCSGIVFTLHDWFYTTLIPTALLMGHQQYLLRHRQPQACLRAFSNNHWIGLLIFAGIVVGTYPF
ncbi:MAG TPA: UbiA family prenyltransferase, partial [Gammaproteobacteria bacterium]|nr:UbiA family prenyltransferase [Gammaproteobacteria bacterium]